MASLLCSCVAVGPFGPGIRVPLDRIVPPPPIPEASAVPAEFVPGGGVDELLMSPFSGVERESAIPVVVPGSTLGLLPLPLGSLPALFWPAEFAGPGGTPLVPSAPAPAEPAFGEPAALPLVPPLLPEPVPPPPLWAWAKVDPRLMTSAKAIACSFMAAPPINQARSWVIVPKSLMQLTRDRAGP